MKERKLLPLVILFISVHLYSQQLPDTVYKPIIKNKAYKNNNGTIIYIDEAHRNFHTKNNRFIPFANVLKQDGYQIAGFENKFSDKSLNKIKVLIISNPLSAEARAPFVTPTKSAFTKEEIKAVKKWVKKGGSLFLIADHMPFAGAALELGKAFGFTFYDSFLFDENRGGILDFKKKEKELTDHKITKSINKIRTFTGQAFKIPKKATSILNLKKEFQVFLPDTMWIFNKNTKRFSADKLSQGAILKYGKGRVAVFGEAAMFTAQLAGRNRFKVGMNAKEASENYKLLLNIIHWLDRKD